MRNVDRSVVLSIVSIRRRNQRIGPDIFGGISDLCGYCERSLLRLQQAPIHPKTTTTHRIQTHGKAQPRKGAVHHPKIVYHVLYHLQNPWFSGSPPHHGIWPIQFGCYDDPFILRHCRPSRGGALNSKISRRAAYPGTNWIPKLPPVWASVGLGFWRTQHMGDHFKRHKQHFQSDIVVVESYTLCLESLWIFTLAGCSPLLRQNGFTHAGICIYTCPASKEEAPVKCQEPFVCEA